LVSFALPSNSGTKTCEERLDSEGREARSCGLELSNISLPLSELLSESSSNKNAAVAVGPAMSVEKALAYAMRCAWKIEITGSEIWDQEIIFQ